MSFYFCEKYRGMPLRDDEGEEYLEQVSVGLKRPGLAEAAGAVGAEQSKDVRVV